MRSLLRSPAHVPCPGPNRSKQSGFTLVEILVATAVFGLVAAVVIWGLTMLHHYATIGRLYTVAQTLAQNQIDTILTKGPFNPVSSIFPNPNVLRTDAPYYTDPLTGLISTSTTYVTIHQPAGGQQTVRGTIKTTVKTTDHEYPDDVDLRIRQANVEVKYTYRGKDYIVAMDTMRAPDQ